jgi:hypothetical protein
MKLIIMEKHIVIKVFLAISLITLVFIGVITPTVTAASNGKIAFVSNRDGNYEIYVMNADGSNQQRLTSSIYSDLNPTLSPDGTKIVFSTKMPMTRIPGTDIYTITTNATSCNNFPTNLLVNATDTNGNFNNSVGIPLAVLLPGDVNFDCKINLKDLLYLRRYLADIDKFI